MPNFYKNASKNNEKGQVLLFVVVVMTIALALGVGVSMQTISTISDITESDTAQRALAGAEGIAERSLEIPDTVLDAFVQAKEANNHSAFATLCDTWFEGALGLNEFWCVISYNPDPNDNVLSQARVTFDHFKFNNTTPPSYSFALQENRVKQINLDGNTSNMNICWTEEAALMMNFYDTGDVYGTLVVNCAGCGPSGGEFDAANQSGIQVASSGGLNYRNCFNLSGYSSLYQMDKLRIRSLGEDTNVVVMPENPGAFPNQGFKITAIGTLDVPVENPVQKIIRVYKSYMYAPAPFDFAVYSENDVSTVSVQGQIPPPEAPEEPGEDPLPEEPPLPEDPGGPIIPGPRGF